MYILYGSRFSRSLITEMVMAEGKLEFEIHTVDIFRQEHSTEEYLAINPAGRVPALRTPENQVIYETPAINLYLGDRHRISHLVPGAEESERGLFLSGFFYITSELEPLLKQFYFPHRFALRNADVPAQRQHALDMAYDRLAVIDERLAQNGPFHLGARYSLADLTLSFWIVLLDSIGKLKQFHAISRCANLVARRPGLQNHFEDLGNFSVEYARLQAQGKGVT